MVFALGKGDVRRGDGGVAANGPLVNCRSVGVGDYRLTLVVESERGALVVGRGPLSQATASRSSLGVRRRASEGWAAAASLE